VQNGRRHILLAVGFFAGYLCLAWLCHVRAATAAGITPWHPQTGLALAFLIVCGPRWGVLVALAALVGELWLVNPVVPVSGKVLVAGCIGLGYAGLAAWLRALLPGRALRNAGDAAWLACTAGGVTLLVALAYVWSYVLVGTLQPGDALRGIARYWLADLNGVLMLTPLVALRESRAEPGELTRRRIEVMLQFFLVLALPWLILSLPDLEQLRFFYLLFVPVIWIALRWNWVGALPGVIVIQSMLILAAEARMNTPRFADLQGLLLTLSLSALLLGAVVAERRRSEIQLREREIALSRAMRFAVAGELASALAHELNQPITALVSYLNASEMMTNAAGPEDPRLRTTLRKAGNEAIRAAEVLHRLRNLYISGLSRHDPVDVVALCHAVGAAYADRLRATQVRLEIAADPAVPVLRADETQLEIVLHNLLANAIDAASQNVGGDRRIVMRISAGPFITITVEDSGTGIADSLAQQLFEPFVTSKPDGMGLGLAISRSIVRARGGDISSGTSPRLGGAQFSVTLPLSLPADTDRT
jgi:signal transduction histidine kinase